MTPMTIQEFTYLINYIKQNNTMLTAKKGYPVVKYIDPHIDMRDMKVFSVTLRGYGSKNEFHTTNEMRGVDGSLFDTIIDFLNTPRCVERK